MDKYIYMYLFIYIYILFFYVFVYGAPLKILKMAHVKRKVNLPTINFQGIC